LKEYDLIVVGTGSAMNVVEGAIQENPKIKVAVIDKDDPGGICLTRGCIPSKILLYPAEVVRTIEHAGRFGINVDVKQIAFGMVMERMRNLIHEDMKTVREGLSNSRNIDFYNAAARFIAPYTLKVGDDAITSKTIILGAGSKPMIPPIKGIEEAGYLTSDTLLRLDRLPESLVIIRGGFIGAEYGHFFSAMGSKVTIIDRNQQFLSEEEPEISAIAKKELQKHMEIINNYEVHEAEKTSRNEKKLVAFNRESGERMEVAAEEILVAAGRGPNTDILHPEKGGIKTDAKGWIIVNEYLETSQPNVWALGDAKGRYPFKHVANYDSLVVYYNAILKGNVKADYHAVPHAVFMYPEISSVGLREKEAIEKYGNERVLIGIQRYEDTAKGMAMDVKDYFVKVIVENGTMRILGAHTIGPQASVLIQEIVNLMYTHEQSAYPIIHGMHIHPALSEVVEKAFGSLTPPEQYHHIIEHHYGISV